MSIDLDSLTDEALSELIEDAKALLAKRQSRAAVDRQVADVLRTARDEGVTDAPAAGAVWVQPTSAVDAYLKGDVVEHDGARWEATVDANTWRPGEAGWRKLPDEDGTPAEYVQPSGSADAYQPGDLITWEGETYRCVLADCVWSPADHPPAWEKEK